MQFRGSWLKARDNVERCRVLVVGVTHARFVFDLCFLWATLNTDSSSSAPCSQPKEDGEEAASGKPQESLSERVIARMAYEVTKRIMNGDPSVMAGDRLNG